MPSYWLPWNKHPPISSPARIFPAIPADPRGAGVRSNRSISTFTKGNARAVITRLSSDKNVSISHRPALRVRCHGSHCAVLWKPI